MVVEVGEVGGEGCVEMVVEVSEVGGFRDVVTVVEVSEVVEVVVEVS